MMRAMTPPSRAAKSRSMLTFGFPPSVEDEPVRGDEQVGLQQVREGDGRRDLGGEEGEDGVEVGLVRRVTAPEHRQGCVREVRSGEDVAGRVRGVEGCEAE